MSLLLFLKNNFLFFLFIALELLAFNLISKQNQYKNIVILTSANTFSGYIYDLSNSLVSFLNIRGQNRLLIKDNRKLREAILKNKLSVSIIDSQPILSSLSRKMLSDTNFNLISSRVINNTIHLSSNYITLDKGSADGIRKNMGIINKGIVGKIKTVSTHYSVAYSLLHPNMPIASEIKRTGTICVVNWQNNKVNRSNLQYVPKHVNLKKGDSVVTSGYNAIFPPNILIGSIEKAKVAKHKNFQEVEIKLTEDFSSLKHIYIIKPKRITQDSIPLSTLLN